MSPTTCLLLVYSLSVDAGAMVQLRKAGNRGRWEVPSHSHTMRGGEPSLMAAQTLGLLSLLPRDGGH